MISPTSFSCMVAWGWVHSDTESEIQASSRAEARRRKDEEDGRSRQGSNLCVSASRAKRAGEWIGKDRASSRAEAQRRREEEDRWSRRGIEPLRLSVSSEAGGRMNRKGSGKFSRGGAKARRRRGRAEHRLPVFHWPPRSRSTGEARHGDGGVRG